VYSDIDQSLSELSRRRSKLRKLITALTLSLISTVGFTTSSHADPVIERIGKTLFHPWGMDFLSDTSMIVTERRGRMFKINLESGTRDELSGVPNVFSFRQGGMLDVMVSEEDPSIIYYCYSRPEGNTASTAVDMAKLDGNDLTQTKTIFVANNKSNASIHFGCRLETSGDKLFVTMGDRGSRFDAQDPKIHSGAVVRLNLDGSVPADNPNLDGWEPELYSKGHRNPQGMALNPSNGELWLHEHGPRGGDEINVVKPGENYGWPIVSHGEEYAGGKIGIGTSSPEFEDPLWTWIPSIAPSGMAFYEGEMFPEFKDKLLVGSLKFRSLYAVDLKSDRPVSETPLFENTIGRVRDVAIAPDGSIYLLSDQKDGGLYRLSQ
jgi:glucose/arabinose dehydrogenase